MSRYSRRLWLLVALVVIIFHAGCRSKPATPSPGLKMISPGLPAEGELPADQGRIYGVFLEKGSFLHLVAEQHGADVVVVLSDPDRNELFRVDSPVDTETPENVYVVTLERGTYQLKIEDGSQGKREGRYRLRIQQLRKATNRDRQHAEAEKLFYVAKSQARRGLFKEAQGAYLMAIQEWRELGNSARQADAYFNLGKLQSQFYFWKDAIESLRQCEQLRITVRDEGGRAESLLQLAIAEEKLGELDEAEGYYTQEMQLRSHLGDPDRWISALYNLARIQQNRGKAQDALGNYAQVIGACSQKSCETVRINSLNGRGGIYLATGREDLALDDFERALALAKPDSLPNERASVLTQEALVYADQGNYPRAMMLTEEALKLRKKAGDLIGEGVTLSASGAIYYRAERLGQALAAFQQAGQIFETKRDSGKQVAATTNLGVIHAMQGRSEIALKIFNEALPLAREGGNKPAETAILYGMAYAERERGNPITAEARIEEAIEAMESLRKETDREDLRASFLASREDLYAFKIELLMDQRAIRPRSGDDYLAFQTSERARARGLYEALAMGHDENESEASRGLLAVHRRQREQINQLDLELRRPSLAQERKQELAARLRELISRREDTEASLHASHRNGGTMDLLPSPALWEVQNLILDRDTLLLEYYMYKDRTFLWAVTPTLFRGYELQCPDLRSLATRVYGSLSRSGNRAEKERAPDDLRRLSNCLLGPVADLLENHLIVIVPHDQLQKIPFSVLRDLGAESNGEEAPGALSYRHQIVQLPSVSVLAMLRKQHASRSPAPAFLALLSDPVYGLDDERVAAKALRESSPHDPPLYDFQRLTSSKEEARELRELTRGRTVVEAHGFGANRDWVFRGHLAEAQIVHIAAHGVLNEEQPALSGLALSQYDPQGNPIDGLLRAHEIEDLDLKADLVVLSACQTGLGKDVRGEGLVGLTQGFLSGGASSLLVSLWKVDDRATAELMKRFYHALIGDGRPPVAALHQAQREMQKDAHWHDPFYWSGFVLQGEWRSRDIPQTSPMK